MAPSKDFAVLTNADINAITQKLPPNEPFGQGVNLSLLRQICHQLQLKYGRSRKPRVYKMTIIPLSKHFEHVSCHFQTWCQNPKLFWERWTTTLKAYSHEQQADRARLFLEDAVHLDTEIEGLRILQRFVAVSAYKLFLRAVPEAKERISGKQITAFLTTIGIQAFHEEGEKYGDVVRRGRNWVLFCGQLDALSRPESKCVGAADDGSLTISGSSPGSSDIYGPLLASSVNDAMYNPLILPYWLLC